MPLALAVTGFALRRPAAVVAAVATGAGVAGLVAAVVFVARAGEPDLGGLLERVALWPAYLWLALAGVTVLRGRWRRRGDVPTPAALIST
jgi:hypothetical protein